jgi:hypothetical protein
VTVAALSDGTWDTRENTDVSVTFDEPFSEPPTIVTDVQEIAGGANSEAANVQKDGFLLRARNYSTSEQTIDINWAAVGYRG